MGKDFGLGKFFAAQVGYDASKVVLKAPFKAASFASRNKLLTTGAVVATDHYAFDGKGRGWVLGEGQEMADEFVTATVDEQFKKRGMNLDGGLATMLKENWGTILAGLTSAVTMFSNPLLGKLGLLATIGTYVYNHYQDWLPQQHAAAAGAPWTPEMESSAQPIQNNPVTFTASNGEAFQIAPFTPGGP